MFSVFALGGLRMAIIVLILVVMVLEWLWSLRELIVVSFVVCCVVSLPFVFRLFFTRGR
jgi:hypothetical protein